MDRYEGYRERMDALTDDLTRISQAFKAADGHSLPWCYYFGYDGECCFDGDGECPAFKSNRRCVEIFAEDVVGRLA